MLLLWSSWVCNSEAQNNDIISDKRTFTAFGEQFLYECETRENMTVGIIATNTGCPDKRYP
jgi:hypothetical protein